MLGFTISCSFPVPRKFKDQLGCYTGMNSGLDTLINVHGFYTRTVISDKRGLYKWDKDGKFKEIGIDTFYYSFLFFNDGIFIGDIGKEGLTVSEYLNQAALKGDSVWGSVQGVYEISGDTIKVKFIGNGQSSNQWYGKEVWYRIINKTTIIDFYTKPLVVSKSDKNGEAFMPRRYSDGTPSNFEYVNNMPKSSSWLKQEKWFLCDSN